MKVEVSHTACFEVPADVETVFKLLADVPRSVQQFPNVDALVPLGDNRFRWEMAPIAVLNFSHQVVYACEYVSDGDELGLAWTPVEDVGNSRIAGRWRFERQAGRRTKSSAGARVNFETSGQLDVPVPRLLRSAAAPLVEKQFRSLINRYHDNLKQALSA